MRTALVPALVVLVGAAEAPPAPPLVTSSGPEKVSVTVYRAPYRGEAPIDRARPQGFALISETRTITLPAGRAIIRFEGVAGNIFPETAIVGDLPGDVREKNLDADLLSPRTLYDRALGRRVIIRRTNRKTGQTVEQQAVIRSAGSGAAILETDEGNEALRCSGVTEGIDYPSVPAGLSAKPTLSIETESAVARTVTISLSYLAGGFDWQASYVASVHPSGDRADLDAWITLASSDVTSFEHASTQVVAGRLNRSAAQPQFGNYDAGPLVLRCWPDPSYVSESRLRYAPSAPPPPPPPPAPMMAMAEARAGDIVVTGASRKAVQEELGDLKLYRVPDPVTVAAKAQKQVAFLGKEGVPVTPLFVSEGSGGWLSDPRLTLRTKNKADARLGVPLPAGQVAVFETADARPILVGEAALGDKAVGEDVELTLDESPAVQSDLTKLGDRGRTTRYRLTVTNANRWPIAYEAKIDPGDSRVAANGARLFRRDRWTVWAVTIPANGAMTLDYSITESR